MVHCFNPKIALLGSGQIGGTLALLAGLKGFSNNVVMLDVVEGMPMGKALDLNHAFAAETKSVKLASSNDLSEGSSGLDHADIVVVTAGFPRKPGMSRDDLLAKNAEVIQGVGRAIKARCPDAFVVCITNPLDVMVSVLQKASGLPPNRVVGMGGVLDSCRFCFFLAEELSVSSRDVQTMVLGGHGDDMVPLIGYTSVAGIPLSTIIKMGIVSNEKVQEIVQRTRQAGGEIVGLLKIGSAFVAPASAALQMIESYIRDEKRVLPCCAHLQGEYGVPDCYAGVPVIIGRNGVEKILELPLSDEENELFLKSVENVRSLKNICAHLGFEA